MVRRAFGFDHTTAAGGIPPQETVDYCRGATDAGGDRNGLDGAVLGTCPAFHTGIAVFDACCAVGYAEDSVGADDKAHATSYALLRIKCQCYDVS
jgi:hypothetical protein